MEYKYLNIISILLKNIDHKIIPFNSQLNNSNIFINNNLNIPNLMGMKTWELQGQENGSLGMNFWYKKI